MTRLATRRLIDASAALGAADRALLNIWVNRGLDNAALARMTGMSEDTIADRRRRIVEHLSSVLGLPPEDLRSALNDIAPSPRVGRNGATPPERVTTSANGIARPAVAPAAACSPPVTSTRPPRRRLRWTALSVLVIVVVAGGLILALAAGGSGHHHRRARLPALGFAQATSPATPAGAVSTAGSRRPAGASLIALPGGVPHATGSVAIIRNGPRRQLSLRVSDLPAASHGHYEIWLYDSMTYSEALGRLPNAVRHLSLDLPGDAARYRWIDISFQPQGDVFPSGESRLRSTNPLFSRAAAPS